MLRTLARLPEGICPLLVRGYSASATKLVDVAVNDKTGIATVTMQRPPVNGLNLDLLAELSKTFDELQDNRSRGMILTSASPTVFSAGLDILEMYKPEKERLRLFWTTLQDVWLKLYGSMYPTVAAINGHSPAGGCLLAMSCEYRVMVGPKFTIGLNETQLGLGAPTWFQASMRNTIPQRQAELALTMGRLFTTEEALQVGLIDEIASDKADAIARAEKFFLRFARVSPMARSISKLSFRSADLRALEDDRANDLALFELAASDPKVQKGLEIYLESLKKKSATS